MVKKAWKPTPRALRKLAGKMIGLRAKGAAAYSEAGTISEELARHMKPGDEMKLAEGVVLTMVDPFVGKDGNVCKAWRHVPVERYEFKVTTAKAETDD